MPTPHLEAQPGQIAKTVIVCGDPNRARKMAEHFLEDAFQFNGVRGMLGYTGLYQGKPVSILSVGMGMPSMGIYSHELFNIYDVDQIIRVGTAGSLQKSLPVGSNVLAQAASTSSTFADHFHLPGTMSAVADYSLLRKADDLARESGMDVKMEHVLTSDNFYIDDPTEYDPWKKMGVAAVEMEVAALYLNAARAGKKGLALLKISDSLVEDESMTSAQREDLYDLFELALKLA